MAIGMTRWPLVKKQRLASAPVLLVAAGVGFEGLLQFVSKGAQFSEAIGRTYLGALTSMNPERRPE